MKKFIVPLIVTLCALTLLISSCGDKSTSESCQYQTTMNLDKGNYDAVLQSSCATPMHLGAAYFGKAGYSVTNVINVLISAQTTSANTALRQYMNVLTQTVTPEKITFLDDSTARYRSIPPSSELHKSAQFDLSIVLAVKAVSLLKTVIDLTGMGTLSSCNINGNAIPDDADAATCALLVSGITSTGVLAGPCPDPLLSSATYSISGSDLFFSSATGTYRGMVVTMATVTSPAGCAADYQKLLYRDASGNYSVAVTSGTCMDTLGGTWPCPVTSNIDLVNTFQTSIDGTITALTTALTGTTSADVTQALEDIKAQACGSLASTCTASTIADYIQSHL